MRRAVLVDLAELERPCDEAVVPEQLVHLLRGMRKKRREDRLQVVDGAERDEEDGRRPLTVGLDERPGSLLADVLVDRGRQAHRLGEGGAEAALFDERAHRLEAGLDPREHGLVLAR